MVLRRLTVLAGEGHGPLSSIVRHDLGQVRSPSSSSCRHSLEPISDQAFGRQTSWVAAARARLTLPSAGPFSRGESDAGCRGNTFPL